MKYNEAKTLLNEHHQAHVLRFWDGLADSEKKQLLEQIGALDVKSLARMRAILQQKSAPGAESGLIEPAPVMTLDRIPAARALASGEECLRAGEAGVILVAGGQGSRLGFEGPKGCYKIGPVSNATLFEVHSRKILALERRYGAEIPFYIMTSAANDAETREFFRQNGYFGLSPERVAFFVQGMWPALWEDGRIILENRGRIFTSPDGHGGILSAMLDNRIIENMKNRGLKTLFYFQVDNPLVEIADPVFMGIHRDAGADISVKVCAKRDGDEPIGVVVRRNGRDAVVEYSELTKEQKHEKLPDGNLKFRFGSVAIHIFSLSFLEKEAKSDLPLHLAHKKIACCDDEGRDVKPDKPNGYKFEKFIFDVIPDAAKVMHVEFAREEEFSPVKNREGEDSPAVTRRDMVRKFARWFRKCGVEVPVGPDGEPRFKLEIDPCFANGPEVLRKKLPAGFRISGDVFFS